MGPSWVILDTGGPVGRDGIDIITVVQVYNASFPCGSFGFKSQGLMRCAARVYTSCNNSKPVIKMSEL